MCHVVSSLFVGSERHVSSKNTRVWQSITSGLQTLGGQSQAWPDVGTIKKKTAEAALSSRRCSSVTRMFEICWVGPKFGACGKTFNAKRSQFDTELAFPLDFLPQPLITSVTLAYDNLENLYLLCLCMSPGWRFRLTVFLSHWHPPFIHSSTSFLLGSLLFLSVSRRCRVLPESVAFLMRSDMRHRGHSWTYWAKQCTTKGRNLALDFTVVRKFPQFDIFLYYVLCTLKNCLAFLFYLQSTTHESFAAFISLLL